MAPSPFQLAVLEKREEYPRIAVGTDYKYGKSVPGPKDIYPLEVPEKQNN